MMKKNNILAITLLGGFVLLAAGCVKEADMNEKYRPEGTPIIFTAVTGYENGDGTRTEYSGSFWNGNTDVTNQGLSSYAGAYERIDWVSNDPITIYYKHPDQSSTSANYKVSGNPSADKEISDASIAVDNSQQLVWAGGGGANSHVFTAMYPKYNFGGNTGISFDGTNVKGYIPASQTLRTVNNNSRKFLPQMQYAYMVAYKAIDGSSTEHTVALPFKPAYTAFEFHFKKPTNAPSYKVTAFEMSSSSTDLAGGFAFSITGGDQRGASWGTVSNWADYTRSRSISVSFGAGVALSESDDLVFTLLALPINLSGITLTLTYNDGTTSGITKSVTLSNTFTACKKYIISNSKAGAGLEYIIEEIDDIVTYGHDAVQLNVNNIKSYRRGVDGTIEAVRWMAQYWDGSQWQTWNAQQDGFSLSSYTGNGVSNLANSETRTVSLIANSQKETVTKTSTQILQETPAVTNHDLSLHDVFGNEHAQTTANCYVISAPGTYRFPCVYGNAITNGSTNYESFAPGRSPSSIESMYTTYVGDVYDTAMGGRLPIRQFPDVNYNRYFRNALNLEITRPYVIEDINSRSGYSVTGENVAIVWQDEQILSDSDFSIITVDGHKYIQFSLSAANIKPGNVVVALRGAAGGDFTDTKTILWSWQLWITERDLTPIDDIMPLNLGWNKVYTGSQKYTDRKLPIRLIQIAPSDDPNGAIKNEEFTVTQIGDSEDIAENVGTNPYYQWGRKDPMIPGIYDSAHPNIVGEPCADKTIYPGSDYTSMNSIATLISTDSTPTVPDYGTAIRNPHVVYIAGQHAHYGTTSWIAGYVPTWATITGDGGRSGGVFQGERVYTAIPYNLWNSYCIGYGIPGTDWSSSTKFKTVYDPCPPGFTVPHRGLEDLLGSGTDAPDHSGKYFSMQGGAVQFVPYAGARIFYNTTNVIPGTSVVVPDAGIYLRHVAGSTNEFGLYWTDCPSQFTCTNPNLPQPDAFDLSYYTHHFHSQMYLFTSSSEDTMDYTKGTAGAIRPMVDPRY